MAITYDYTYNIVGSSLGAVNNTASSSAALTGLTTGEIYEVGVRQRQDESGVIYLSAVDVETFTPIVSDVVVDLSTISHSAVLNPIGAISPLVIDLGNITPNIALQSITPIVPISGTSYNLKLRHVEGATTTIVADILSPSYALTGLTVNDNYEVSIQTVDRSAGAEYLHPYTAVVAFVATVPSWNILGTIAPSVTLNAITPYVDQTIRVDLGLINNPVTLNTLVAYMVVPIIVELGSISPAITVNSMGIYQEGLALYTLEVEQVNGATVVYEEVGGNSLPLSSLIADETYNVRVIQEDNALVHEGVTYFTGYSETLTFLSAYRPPVIVELGSLTTSVLLSPLTAFDRVLRIANFAFDNLGDNFIITGDALPSVQSMTITVDGNPMAVTLDGTSFVGTLLSEALEIPHMEELDGYQTLTLGNTLIEVQ